MYAAAALLVGAHAHTSSAKSKQKPKYVFAVHQVKDKGGAPAEMPEMVRKQFVRAIDAHPDVVTSAGPGAPAPSNEAAYKKHLKRRGLRAFKVNVDILKFSKTVRNLEAPKRGKRIDVTVKLRAFGETLPGRAMAFSGEGSAMLGIEVGRRVRPRDVQAALQEAGEVAVADALKACVDRLRRGHKKPKRK